MPVVAEPSQSLTGTLSALRSLALDLRWTWNHGGDALWSYIDSALWDSSHNPWAVLRTTPARRFQELAGDATFNTLLSQLVGVHQTYLQSQGWFRGGDQRAQLGGVAYFSMEFGLGSVLPLYAGGLGVLAGDFLKTASDLDVPLVGIGLLYQEGYFRQMLDSSGAQQEFYPYNEPAAMPIGPALAQDGSQLRIALELPGRTVYLRVWQVSVGRIKLYLLDSNDILNTAPDRGITTKLYGGGAELRLMQEIVLGVGGWRIIEALHPEIDICHINEGHAAFAVIERARHVALKQKIDFWEALWATRAGNLFTTHTPVGAGFDEFETNLLCKYLPYVDGVLAGRGVELEDVLALGRLNARDNSEPFKMAYLALRGSGKCVGVSRLHGEFSRRLFQPLFPRWPTCEVPVSHVTNGVHIPTWDSAEADRVWTEACGKERWRSLPHEDTQNVISVPDEVLWTMRGKARKRVVELSRARLGMHLRERGATPEKVKTAESVLDANVLTLGFARRFTEYKRPNLLLSDPERFIRLLRNEKHPVQIILAGKAHPADMAGKQMIQQWIDFASREIVRHQVVFLEDYDIDLAQELIQGVDLWINTPRRPWEACGTSGMKILVNGGLNCSILDGWWDEAYGPGLGWAIGDARGGPARTVDAEDAAHLYRLLETEIAPEFYARAADGLPRAWLKRIRASMAILTPAFSSARMLHDYIEQAYLPLAKSVRERMAQGCIKGRELNRWSRAIFSRWSSLHIGNPTIGQDGKSWHVTVPIYLGEIQSSSIRVELFAEGSGQHLPEVIFLHQEQPILGSTNGYVYAGVIETPRPISDYTIRVVPYHPDANLPVELPLIAWQH